MNYTRYRCPVCGEEMARTMTKLFMHSDLHTPHVMHPSHLEGEVYELTY